jgi:signal peptide peptidase SppA
MKLHQENAWAGTESSLKAALEAEEGAAQRLAAGNYTQDQEEEDTPRLLEISDGVAVISIKGSLNNEEGWMNEIFGMTGYPEIRDALVTAANDPEVKQILLDIDSGGGAVSGVSDTANLIRMVNDQVKPVSTFSDGTMASAAYWLGCAAGSISAGKTAVVGSIGVISTHMERSQALKEAGIGVTVIRAGKFKALANSVEPLSAEGKAQIQQVVDAAYGVFVDHVATMRGQTYDYTDQTMAQGQEFVGEAGVKVGLLDSISTFDEVIGKLKAQAIDSSNNFMDNRGKPRVPITGAGGTSLSGEADMKNKRALTEANIAALAAGASALNAGDVEAPTPEAIAAAAAALAETDAATAAALAASESDAAAAAAAVDEEVVTEKVDTSATTVQLLNSQLAAKDEALLQAGIKISKLEDLIATTSASADPLREIACKSLNNMRVALNMAAVDMSAMSGVQIVAEHVSLSEKFAAQYQIGGIAAVSAEQSNKQEPQSNPRHKALVNAVRFNQSK